MHGCAPRPSLSELAGVEVAVAVEVTAGAWVDRAMFVATLRRCAWSLEEFGATRWLLEMLAGGGQGGGASSIAAAVRDAKEWFERFGTMLGCV